MEKGDRGDGIHHDWMNDMKTFGVKHASFIFKFEWKEKKIESLVVDDISYHPDYYNFSVKINEERVLQQIKDTGLEEKLKARAIELAKIEIPVIMKEYKANSGCGTLYENLLDDERLPLINTDMPLVKINKN